MHQARDAVGLFMAVFRRHRQLLVADLLRHDVLEYTVFRAVLSMRWMLHFDFAPKLLHFENLGVLNMIRASFLGHLFNELNLRNTFTLSRFLGIHLHVSFVFIGISWVQTLFISTLSSL